MPRSTRNFIPHICIWIFPTILKTRAWRALPIGIWCRLRKIAKPDKVFACHLDVLKAGLEHEEYVTSLINDIYAAAYEVKDFRTMQFLDWFVKEQGEEETNANDMITKMELFGSDPKSLYMLNQELAARVYTAPSLVL